tara:strand:+ start:2026 stop:3888 length:1863 start_codon:yes stop_codon:yes gene_type:complete
MAEEYRGPFGITQRPKRKIGEIGQGILGGIETGSDFLQYFNFPFFPTSTPAGGLPRDVSDSVVDYLESPSEFSRDVSENQLKPEYKGIDLADIPGSGVGRPDFAQNALDALGTLEGAFIGDPSIPLDAPSKTKPITGPGFEGLGPQDITALEEIKKINEKRKKEKEKAKTATTAIANLSQQFAEDEMGRGTSQATIEDAFIAGMDDFLETVRGAKPDTKTKDLEKYKKEFADATGIDISGKVDKSHALMTFGLALMQNKAGKGFNVGKMLSAVGKAGETALPALEKAREKARAGAAAAGKYALTARAADQATDAANLEKSLAREKYWVYEKGAKGAEFEKFDKGEFIDVSKYELNELLNNPDFDKNYEFIDAKDRFDVLAKRAEGLDLGDEWGSDYKAISLIGGDPKDIAPALQVLGVSADPNFKGKTSTPFKLGEPEEDVINRFIGYQNDITKDSKMFGELISFIDKGGVSIPAQVVSNIQQLGRSLGFNAGEATDTASAKRLLQNIAIDEATRILQESGKTLSDADRALVRDRVSKINFTLAGSDPATIKNQLQDIYDLVVVKAQKNLDTAVSELQNKFGVTISPNTDNFIPTENELKIINQNRKRRGQKPLTMGDFT